MRIKLVGALLAAVILAGCASSTSGSPTSTTRAPLPAGPHPSRLATMVCAEEANAKFNKVLGENGTVTSRSWDVTSHTYSCELSYSTGTLKLSVKELSSWPATFAYFNGLKAIKGNAGSIGNLGQGAFRTNDGSIIVRKDWKVLDVNITGLPAMFGVPATASSDVAYTVADLVLQCWAGD